MLGFPFEFTKSQALFAELKTDGPDTSQSCALSPSPCGVGSSVTLQLDAVSRVHSSQARHGDGRRGGSSFWWRGPLFVGGFKGKPKGPPRSAEKRCHSSLMMDANLEKWIDTIAAELTAAFSSNDNGASSSRRYNAASIHQSKDLEEIELAALLSLPQHILYALMKKVAPASNESKSSPYSHRKSPSERCEARFIKRLPVYALPLRLCRDRHRALFGTNR